MANITGQITVDQLSILEVDADPSAAAGTDAPLGSFAIFTNGTIATCYLKTSSVATGWELTTTASTFAGAVLGRANLTNVGAVPFVNTSGILTQDSLLNWNNTLKELTIGPTGAVLANNPLSINGNVNNTLQGNVQNINAGSLASSDIVATSDDGTDTANYVNLGINSSTNTDATFTIAALHDSYLTANGGRLVIGTEGAKDIKFYTGGTLLANERMRIDSTGIVIVGSQAIAQDISGLSVFPSFQVLGTNATQMVAAQFSANTIPSVFNLLKSRGAAVNTQGALILNDEVGQLQFRGSDGTNFQVTASVRAAIDGAVSAGVMPGRLIFMTTTAAGVLTERMRISQDGTILMGGFLNAANGLRLSNTTDATNGNIRFNGVGLEFYRNGWRDLSFPKYTYDDFNFPALGATANQNGFSAVIVAGGTGVLSGSGSGTNNMGIVTLGTGITNNTNGVAALDGTSSLNKIQLAGYPVTIEWRIQIPTLSTAAVNFQTRIGLQDGNAGGDPTNGVYFSYNQANNTGGWQAITRSASISTTVNSSIVVVAGTYYRIRAEINAAATNVDFYIDSGAGYVLIGSSTTNIPTAAMRPIAKINKVITATTITSIFNCDWCWWNMER